MIVLIVFIVVLETGQFHVVLPFYVSKTKFTCMHIQAKFSGQKIKIKTRKEELVYASTVFMKISVILKDSLIIQKRKLKMTYFLLKQQVWGHGSFTVSRNFSRELECDLPLVPIHTRDFAPGACSGSKAPPCVPMISWVYSVPHPLEQNSHPAKCSTIFNRLNIWEQAPRAN